MVRLLKILFSDYTFSAWFCQANEQSSEGQNTEKKVNVSLYLFILG